MSKNIVLNGKTYNNASYLKTETTDGKTALFKETSEITTPSGSLEIKKNGAFDVTNFAQALVDVSGSGVGYPITGFYETKAKSLLGVDLPIGEVNASKFLVIIQLVETGTYATMGDATSQLTMDDVVTGYGNDFMLYAGIYFADVFDTTIEYQQPVQLPVGIRGGITSSNKFINVTEAPIVTYNNGVLTISPTGDYSGHLNKYCKYKYTVYPLG